MGSLSTAAAALPAGNSTIDARTLAQTLVASYGDIFRALPGFEVANYGQGAIGYGLSMRGYTNAEHGRDIAYYIDGVPVNDISSIHTPNYADLSVLMPETVQSIEVVRGPFDVECGDSNLGGCVNITTKNSEPFASVGASGGTYGTVRPVVTYSSQGGDYQPFFVEEGYHTDGYRDNSWVNNYDLFNKVTTQLGDGMLSIRTQAYGTAFGAPGYINRDAVISGVLSPRAAVDATDGGSKYFENLTANYTSGPADQNFTAMLFTNHDVFDRFADFGTSSGQRWQQDERSTVGGRVRKVWTFQTGDDTGWQVLAGTQWRTDFIGAFQIPTTARTPNGPFAENMNDTETDIGPYAQVQWKPVRWLKLTGAERFDQFYYNVTDNLTPSNSTNINPGIWSPKAGITFIPVKWWDFYANYGQGFRSIDAATELIGNPTIQPFKIESKELGTHLDIGRAVFHADIYKTHSENEAFQAAPGLPETLLGAADLSRLRPRCALLRRQGCGEQRLAVRELRRGRRPSAQRGAVLLRPERTALYLQYRHRLQRGDAKCGATVGIGIRIIHRPSEHDAGRRADGWVVPARHRATELFLAQRMERVRRNHLVSRQYSQ